LHIFQNLFENNLITLPMKLAVLKFLKSSLNERLNLANYFRKLQILQMCSETLTYESIKKLMHEW
jgi:hypothetical protein